MWMVEGSEPRRTQWTGAEKSPVKAHFPVSQQQQHQLTPARRRARRVAVSFAIALLATVVPLLLGLVRTAVAAPAQLPQPAPSADDQEQQHQRPQVPESISLRSLQGHLIGGGGVGGNQSRETKRIIVTGALDAGGFITTEKKAHLSGLRVEPDELGELGDEGFIGYTEKGVSIVRPGIRVRIVLFGWWLDEVVMIGFTPDDNCSNTLDNIHQADFTIQTEKRVVVKYEFHQQSSSLYKVCMKQKPRETKTGEQIEMPYSLIDDLRTSISTDLPPRKYYFPIAAQVAIIGVLLVLSGLFSGLNLGLMSLTPQVAIIGVLVLVLLVAKFAVLQELLLISKSGSKQERLYAEAILPVRKTGNQLLCSVLIGNVCVNSAISILFDDLTSGYVALIVSSAGIVIFGEIFPQSLCVKKGLAVGAHTIWITRFFMVLTWPLAFPISKILDCVLGEEVVSYDRKRLMELMKMSTRDEEGLAEEFKIALGAMEISDKTVYDVMTRIDDVFMLPETTVLNTKTVAEILRMGYTRIPIYAEGRNNVVSLLFVKDLALLDPDDNFTVKMVCAYHEHALRFVMKDTPLRVMLEEFKKGDYHLAMVQEVVNYDGHDPLFELVGIVTLEDIVEEILQAEIVDETDAITDNVHRIRRRRAQEHEFSHCLLDNDASDKCLISMQMQLVTIQWLATNHHAFHNSLVSQSVLEKVIRQHVHKLELSHLADMNDPKMVYPRTSRLYTKREPSDKFILILEGRAMVTIGQNEMTFEAGPWHCFGNELLDRLLKIIEQQNQQQQGSTPQQQPVAATATTATAQQAQKGPAMNTRSSQGTLFLLPTGTGSISMPSGQSANQQQLIDFDEKNAKKITFVPDYSAVIRDDCTYLEISAQTYLLAYKSTLINKNKGEKDAHQGVGGGSIFHVGEEIPLNKINAAGLLEEEVALLRSNGSLKRRSDELPRKRSGNGIARQTSLASSPGETRKKAPIMDGDSATGANGGDKLAAANSPTRGD